MSIVRHAARGPVNSVLRANAQSSSPSPSVRGSLRCDSCGPQHARLMSTPAGTSGRIAGDRGKKVGGARVRPPGPLASGPSAIGTVHWRTRIDVDTNRFLGTGSSEVGGKGAVGRPCGGWGHRIPRSRRGSFLSGACDGSKRHLASHLMIQLTLALLSFSLQSYEIVQGALVRATYSCCDCARPLLSLAL